MTGYTMLRIETENLILRPMTRDDGDALFEMRRDHRMHEHTDTRPDESLEETLAYIDKMNKGIAEGKWVVWAIEQKASGKVIGSISLWNYSEEEQSAELGYGIAPNYQGKGYMREALLAAVNHGFEVMAFKQLDAYTEEGNLSSIKLLEKCKFALKGQVEDQGYHSERVFHMRIYRLER